MSSELEKIHNQVLTPEVVKVQGAGKAYQMVAQSMAIAIQDATDHLRNISTISSTAVAVTTELMIANPDKFEQYSKILDKAQGSISKATFSFGKVGKDAGQILKDFPSGSE